MSNGVSYNSAANMYSFGNITLDTINYSSSTQTLGSAGQTLVTNGVDTITWTTAGSTGSGIGTISNIFSTDSSIVVTNPHGPSTGLNVNSAHTTNYTVPLNTSVGYEISGSTALTVSGSAIIVGPSSSIINIGSGANTTGANSIAIGNLAGNTGQLTESIALGDHAGQISQGAFCTALAGYAGNSNQHNYCVAVGYGSGATNQGTEAVALGAGSGATNQGLGSIALGYSAGNANLGIASIAVGLSCNVLGDAGFNTMIGYLNTIHSGSTNSSSLGANSAILTSNEIVLGDGHVVDVRSGSSGLCSLGTTGYPFSNVYTNAINGSTVPSLTNIAYLNANQQFTAGNTFQNAVDSINGYNIQGNRVLTLGGTGYDNTSIYIGNQAGRLNSANTSTYNTFIGYGSGNFISSGSFNVGIGRLSLEQVSTGSQNTSINGGLNQLTVGSANTTVGYDSFGTLVSGNYNTGLGEYSGLNCLTSNNVALGYASGYKNDIGANNTLCGGNCLSSQVVDTSNGMSNITALGANITCNTGTAWNNSIAIGQGVNITKSNQCTIGNTGLAEIIPSSNLFCNLGSTTNYFNNVYANNINGITASNIAYLSGSNQIFTNGNKFTNFCEVVDNGFLVLNNSDQTKNLAFSLSGNTSGAELIIATNQSTTQSLAIPDVGASDTIATLGVNQSFTGTNIINKLTDSTTYGSFNMVNSNLVYSTVSLNTSQNYVVSLTDRYIFYGSTGITLTLPNPVSFPGRILTFINTNQSNPGVDAINTGGRTNTINSDGTYSVYFAAANVGAGDTSPSNNLCVITGFRGNLFGTSLSNLNGCLGSSIISDGTHWYMMF